MKYQRPASLKAALDLRTSPDFRVVAGATDYFAASNSDLLGRGVLDLTKIGELSGISKTSHGWRIGAMTTWSEIAQATLPACFSGLQSAAKCVGGIQIQNAGTVGGNLCNASPAADGVPPLLAMEASVQLQSVRGMRDLPLQDFLLGVRSTALAEDEVLTSISVPDLPAHAVGSFEKLGSRSYLVISICMTSAVIGLDDSGRIDFARVAVGACSPVALRLFELEEDLVGQLPSEVSVTAQHLARLSPIDDVRGSGAYRKSAVQEQCRRAIRSAGGAV